MVASQRKDNFHDERLYLTANISSDVDPRRKDRVTEETESKVNYHYYHIYLEFRVH